jgi:hypothetical protein
MAIILKANEVNVFVSSVVFVFWFHSPNVLDTPRIVFRQACDYRRLLAAGVQFGRLIVEECAVVWRFWCRRFDSTVRIDSLLHTASVRLE